jgi:transcriptional regulator with XRE-family HTH domain
MDTIDIRREIIARRKELGLTQAGLGARARVSRELVSKYEGGNQDIGINRLVRLCGALGLEVVVRVGRGRPVFEDIDALFMDDE